MLQRCSIVKNSNSAFLPGWKPAPDDVVLVNEPFGALVHVVVTDESGSPKYDQPMWSEPAGAVCVTVDAFGQFVLVEQFRSVLRSADCDPEYPPFDLRSYGCKSLEFPRGFPQPGELPEEAARREVEEETGLHVVEVQLLGASNSNTTYCCNSNLVYLVRVENTASGAKADVHERIQGVHLLTLNQLFTRIAQGEILCGMTKAALMHFVASSDCQ